jgi:hypothetical protein
MYAIAATEVKNRLGEIYDELDRDPGASVLIERNKKPAAMLLPHDVARQGVLLSYVHGMSSRSVVMRQLGFTWYGQLLDALSAAQIGRPTLPPKEASDMVEVACCLLRPSVADLGESIAP